MRLVVRGEMDAFHGDVANPSEKDTPIEEELFNSAIAAAIVDGVAKALFQTRGLRVKGTGPENTLENPIIEIEIGTRGNRSTYRIEGKNYIQRDEIELNIGG